MNRDFKFPPSPTGSPVITEAVPSSFSERKSPPAALPVQAGGVDLDEEARLAQSAKMITPSAIEVPPPPPVEKERSAGSASNHDDGDDEVGDTVEVDLS
ncbi:hypothetical protein D9757_009312 [Collybiopsis confluens]|uniref:Uncharacterized protein n=1 Tax=Collybiopsis confluens TaxID=2823264 RepID=A0A8H5H497_9AGAR|nr:hypothetical protein D9757_009312 [Collybiopsis confluens]